MAFSLALFFRLPRLSWLAIDMIATVLVHMMGLMLRKLEELEQCIGQRLILGVVMFVKLVHTTAVLTAADIVSHYGMVRAGNKLYISVGHAVMNVHRSLHHKGH